MRFLWHKRLIIKKSGITRIPSTIGCRQEVKIRQIRTRSRQQIRQQFRSCRSITIQRIRPITRRQRSNVRGGDITGRVVQAVLRRWYGWFRYVPADLTAMESEKTDMAKGGFDTGPGFVFNLGGGPGVRVHQFGGGRPRRRPRAEGEPPQSASSVLTSLLPLILLFIFPLLSSLFSSSGPTGPAMTFTGAAPPLTHKLVSEYHKVPYWVNKEEIKDYSKKQKRALSDRAERSYLHHLQVSCDAERQEQNRLAQLAQGWFFQDEAMMQRARNMKMENCVKLNEMTTAANRW